METWSREDVIITAAEGNYCLPSMLTYLRRACAAVYALFVFTSLPRTHL